MLFGQDSIILLIVFAALCAVVIHLLLLGLLNTRKQKTSSSRSSSSSSNNNNNRIPHVWSWWPYVGSAVEMGSLGPLSFIEKHCQRLNSPLFTAVITGKRCLFLGDSRLLQPLLFANNSNGTSTISTSIDRDAIQIHAFITIMGISKQEAIALKKGPINKEYRSQFNHYLLKTDSLAVSIQQAQHYFDLRIKDLLELCNNKDNDDDDWMRLGLFETTRQHIYEASVIAIMSKTIAKEGFIPLFQGFLEGAPLAYANVPKLFLPTFTAASDKLLQALLHPEFAAEGTDFIKARQGLGLSKESLARANLGLLMGTVGNSIPLVFWMVYSVLADRDASPSAAYDNLQLEVDRICASLQKDVQDFTLQELDLLKGLASTFKETCRMQFGGFDLRDVTQDFLFEPNLDINNNSDHQENRNRKYLIPKGTRIMGYVGVEMYDEYIYECPHEFRWNRFVVADQGNTKQQPQFRDRNGKVLHNPANVFGGGSVLCPGRKFIAYEAIAYVAMLLSNFDLRLSSDDDNYNNNLAAPPGPDKMTQGFGMNLPDREVYIEIRPRRRSNRMMTSGVKSQQMSRQ